MAERIWTAAELEKLSPAEQDRLFAASIVTDLDAVPAEFVEQVRERVQHHVDESETTPR
jgi:hypothetical protein